MKTDLVHLDLGSRLTQDLFNPYQISKILNSLLLELGFKVIPSQMMYNYNKNGLISGIKNQKMYTKEEVELWITKYLTKKIS
jgi:hypothetical protein